MYNSFWLAEKWFLTSDKLDHQKKFFFILLGVVGHPRMPCRVVIYQISKRKIHFKIPNRRYWKIWLFLVGFFHYRWSEILKCVFCNVSIYITHKKIMPHKVLGYSLRFSNKKFFFGNFLLLVWHAKKILKIH